MELGVQLFGINLGPFPYDHPLTEFASGRLSIREDVTHEELDRMVFDFVKTLENAPGGPDIDDAGYRILMGHTPIREALTYSRVDNYSCRLCVHYQNCKRIDHDRIMLAKSWFMCYETARENGTICSEFEPNAALYEFGARRWKGIGHYITERKRQYVRKSGPEKTEVSLVLHHDFSERFQVSYLDWFNGNIVEEREDGRYLRAVSHSYYLKSKESPTGYVLHSQEPLTEFPKIDDERGERKCSSQRNRKVF